jgi:hypothetical protein
VKFKIYFTSGQTVEFETNQFRAFDTFIGQLSQIQPGHFLTIDASRSIARDHVQFIEQLDD